MRHAWTTLSVVFKLLQDRLIHLVKVQKQQGSQDYKHKAVYVLLLSGAGVPAHLKISR